jgi:hypothetical protein
LIESAMQIDEYLAGWHLDGDNEHGTVVQRAGESVDELPVTERELDEPAGRPLQLGAGDLGSGVVG